MNLPNPSRCLTFSILAAALSLGGCMTAPQHRDAVRDNPVDRLTVGTVQKEIHLGMSGAEVIATLGAPNIVTTDEERREVWTYDRIATEIVHSSSGASISPLIFGSGGSMLGGATGGLSQSSGAESRTQRTLTVIIRFDEQKKVRDFAYHASQF
jgi:outer membrane protein assembly factor BamE (lipoprotein component of BamABCDE complex)